MVAPTNFYQPYAAEHQDPKGEGDARPTAMKIIEDQDLIGKWTDKVVLVTGANAGIGLETARALHATGAKLFITARSRSKGEPVVKDILASSPSQTPIEIIELELDNLASVRAAAGAFLGRSEQLNVLIANAGVMAAPFTKTQDGFESQMGINYFAHFLLFQLLKPVLLSSSTHEFASRVVTVSSSGHKICPVNFNNIQSPAADGYNKWGAYGESKTAAIWMANGIDRRYGGQGLHGFSVHPGTIFQTTLGRYLEPADFEFLAQYGNQSNTNKNTAQGAATQVWCATAKELEGRGGLYSSDCGVAKPVADNEPPSGGGYAPYAYDEASENQLWEIGCDTVGVPRA
ncbi:NAD(P)-binding protein [Myriangium duriaei CBS 260.36]|uniref:NAD(P)-binding protein n=1 Tax=Myriangium duriaei CBS 260.36 TaxID=1168546 RepID=A0A9P4JC21_9PEZI|nr:NAD(P)-binding protein [Myriangium duriaei CBS 260.36]